jgi:hypothetical protein
MSRRRAQSHNPYRIPRAYRDGILKELSRNFPKVSALFKIGQYTCFLCDSSISRHRGGSVVIPVALESVYFFTEGGQKKLNG